MVDEKEKTEENQKETTDENTDAGDQPKSSTPSIIEQANAAAERLAKENERMAELIRRQEEIVARDRIGGNSSGDSSEKKEEDDPAEYAKKALMGQIPKK